MDMIMDFVLFLFGLNKAEDIDADTNSTRKWMRRFALFSLLLICIFITSFFIKYLVNNT